MTLLIEHTYVCIAQKKGEDKNMFFDDYLLMKTYQNYYITAKDNKNTPYYLCKTYHNNLVFVNENEHGGELLEYEATLKFSSIIEAYNFLCENIGNIKKPNKKLKIRFCKINRYIKI